MLMLVMAVAVALSVVLATRDAAVVDDGDVFMIMAVGDGGLDSAWLVERIDYALSNLSCSIAGGMVVVGITAAIILALGYSSTSLPFLSLVCFSILRFLHLRPFVS